MTEPENTQYGRCEATNRQGNRCGRAAIGGHGKCGYHGGKSPTVHKMRQDWLSDEDQAIYDAVADTEPHEQIREEMDMVKTKLLRASREAGGNDGEAIAREIISQAQSGAVDDDLVGELAGLLSASHDAIDRARARLVQLSKEYRKWTENEEIDLNVSGEVENDLTDETEQALNRLSENLEDVYGDE